MSKGHIGKAMGEISNLITDMTLKGATDDELARAVRHSMVVIDAYKHKLDYKQSEKDNNIEGLKKKYQAHTDDDKYGGASTLISRAKSQTSVPERKGQPHIDPETGELIYKESGRTKTVTRKDGTSYEVPRTIKSTKMAEAKDARTLISDFDTPEERAYADYANTMKELAKGARKEMLATGKINYSSSAKATYQEEVDHLNAQLNLAKKNAPREREAQRIANSVVEAKKQENPGIDTKELKKMKQQALTSARQTVGAERKPISISEREWEAIQSGAITDSKLADILNFADPKTVRQYATPRSTSTLSDAKINKIKAMNSSNYTIQEIADSLGVSTATVSKYLK